MRLPPALILLGAAGAVLVPILVPILAPILVLGLAPDARAAGAEPRAAAKPAADKAVKADKGDKADKADKADDADGESATEPGPTFEALASPARRSAKSARC